MLKWLKNLLGICLEEQKYFYISWYDAPITLKRRYLKKDNHDGSSYYYVDSMDSAERFSTYEECLKVTPVYDGSSGIGIRTGVKRVYCQDNGRLAEW